MEISRTGVPTKRGPEEWFTGDVLIDPLTEPDAKTVITLVRFAPGARTAWHAHYQPQVLYVTEGIGLVQLRGEPIQVIRAGDRVVVQPGEDHWHGGAPDRYMCHLALYQIDREDGEDSEYRGHVTDEEYDAAPNVAS